MGNFKLLVRDIYVNTNLEVRLKSRTTKEEANKEVELSKIAVKKRFFTLDCSPLLHSKSQDSNDYQ